MKKLILAFAMLFILGGCASIVSDSSQTMTVRTPNCPEATCDLLNSKGSYHIKETPQTIPVNKSYGDLTVTCSKGKDSMTQKYESSATGSIWGNIFLGGIIGGAIDAGTGKGFEYEDTLIHPLKCDKNE